MENTISGIPFRGKERPTTLKIEFGHEQLDNFSPSDYRERMLEEITKWPGVKTGRSKVSEPQSIGLFLDKHNGPENAFLFKNTNEFAHIHTTGFLHISVPPIIHDVLIDNGWGEIHPVSKRPEFYDNIIMIYSPVNENELEFVIKIIKATYYYALG